MTYFITFSFIITSYASCQPAIIAILILRQLSADWPAPRWAAIEAIGFRQPASWLASAIGYASQRH